MIFAAVSVVINVAGSLLLFPAYAQLGIAVATSAAGWANAALLALTLSRRGHYTPDSRLLRTLPRILLCALAMGGFLLAAMVWANPVFTGAWSLPVRILALLALIGALPMRCLLYLRAEIVSRDLKADLASSGTVVNEQVVYQAEPGGPPDSQVAAA